MATAWDDLMKLLSGANPQDLVSFLLPNARFMHAADKELKTRTIEADMLYFIEKNGEEAIIHGEYQRYRDKNMGQRLWEYNVLTTCMTRKKVYSFAIYLRPGGTIVEPPHKIEFVDNEVVHIFYYKNIRLWEIPMEALLQPGLEGLLPLLPLTKGGTRDETVNLMITRLQAANKNDLLVLGYAFAAAVYSTNEDINWLKRRFAVFETALEGSWAYKEIVEKGLAQGLEKGLAQGLEKGLQQGLQQGAQQGKIETQYQTLIEYVGVRFPELVALAVERAGEVEDFATLRRMTFALFSAQTIEQARHILLEEQKEEDTRP